MKTAPKPEDAYWESQATYVIVAGTYPLLLIIGTFGNVLTYHILHRTTLGDRSAASWLFKCLAIMCLSCLWLGLPRHWLRTVYDYDLRKSHYIVCKIHRFLLYCVMDITAWVIVFISMDRLVTVFAPSRSNDLCTTRNAKVAFLGLCVFFAGFNVHIFLAYGRETVKRIIPAASSNAPGNASALEPSEYVKWVVKDECTELKDNDDLVFYNKIIHPYLSFATFVIGPFCLMLISSILISRKLAANRALIKCDDQIEAPIIKRYRPPEISTNTSTIASGEAAALVDGSPAAGLIERQRTSQLGPESARISEDRMSNSKVAMANATAMKRFTSAAVGTKGKSNSQDDQANLERTTTRLTIAASVEFVLTATPAFVVDIIEPFLRESNYFTTGQGKAQFNLIYTSVRLLMFSNFALHFFLFCFTVGRFRKEFKKVLKVWQSFIMIEQRVPSQFELEDQLPPPAYHAPDNYSPPPPIVEPERTRNVDSSHNNNNIDTSHNNNNVESEDYYI